MNERLRAWQMAGARLSAALALSMLIGAGYLAAPVLFAEAPSRQLAGALAGAIFARSHPLALLFLLAYGAFLWRLQGQGRLRWALWALAIALVALELFWFTPEMQAVKAQAAKEGGLEALAPGHPLRQRFELWHGIGAMGHLLAALAVSMLVALDLKALPKR